MATRQLCCTVANGDFPKALRQLRKKAGTARTSRGRSAPFHTTATSRKRKETAAAKKRTHKNFINLIRSVQAMSNRPVSEKELTEIYK